MNLIKWLKYKITKKQLDRLDDLYRNESEARYVMGYCFKQLGNGDIIEGQCNYGKHKIFGTHNDKPIEWNISYSGCHQVIMDYIKYLENTLKEIEEGSDEFGNDRPQEHEGWKPDKI